MNNVRDLVPTISAFACMIISVTVTLAWILHLTTLTRLLSDAPGMVLDTALGVFIAALAIRLDPQKHKNLVRSIGLGLVFIGCFKSLIQAPAFSLHHIVFPYSKEYNMARGTAIALVLLGIALLIRTHAPTSAWWVRGTALLGTMIATAGAFVIMIHVTGLKSAPWWGDSFLNVSILAALCFCLLGAALLTVVWKSPKLGSRQPPATAAVLAVIGLIFMFVGLDAAIWASSGSFLSIQPQIHRTSLEVRAVGDLVEAVRKAESGQRGYLLTGEGQYLEAFQEARSRYKDIDRLGICVDLELLKTALRKFEELQQTISLEANGRHDEAVRMVRSSKGIRLMEQIDARGAADQTRMRAILAKTIVERNKSAALVHQTILISYVIALLLAVTVLFLVRSDIMRRSRVEALLREKEASIVATNRELREQTIRAEEASRSKSSFLASMSHEIRTPMNAILGMADMLWETELGATQRHYVEVFRRAGGNLLTLINDILDLAKIEAGGLTLESIDFDLHETLEQAMEILLPTAQAKGLSLLCHVKSDCPPNLVGDPGRLQQVLLNLVGNALKFTDHGEVLLTVSSQCSPTHATVHFEVADTGIGIPKTKLAEIFHDFNQGDASTTRLRGGTGLGLGISRRLVSLMGGNLQVQSEFGKGSTLSFHASFPIGVAPKATDSPSFADIGGKSVMVVDNNATGRLILGEMCAGWGMTVTTAANGLEAIETVGRASNDPFALALVDRLMPEMDGFEIACRLLDRQPAMKILMVTSDIRSGDLARCKELGLAGYLMRPVRRSELLRKILNAFKTAPAANRESCDGAVLEPEISPKARPHKRILIAEDSDDNRSLLKAYCKGSVYDPTFVMNGEQAVLASESGTYELIAMDVQMPVMDGLMATRAIRAEEELKLGPRIPILALTANALESDIEGALQAGCDVHLAKPISKRAFLDALDKWSCSATEHTRSPKSVAIEIPEGLSVLAHKYLSDRQREIILFQDAFGKSDFGQVGLLAHNLKGTGTSFGFAEVTRLGGLIEQSAKERNHSSLSKQITALARYVGAANQQLAITSEHAGSSMPQGRLA